MALAVLVKHYEKPADFMDYDRVTDYERGLASFPGDLVLEAARLAIETREWFPKVPQLKADCLRIRQSRLEADPFQRCGECSAEGWVSKPIDGVVRMVRCACWLAHQQRIRSLAGGQPLALPSAEDPIGPE